MFSSNSNEIEFFVSFDNKKKNDFHVIYLLFTCTCNFIF